MTLEGRTLTALAALFACATLLVAMGTQRSAGRSALRRAEAAREARDTRAAVAAYRAALEARCPWMCEAPAKAERALTSLVEEAEASSDVGTARMARGALERGTSSDATPRGEPRAPTSGTRWLLALGAVVFVGASLRFAFTRSSSKAWALVAAMGLGLAAGSLLLF